MKSPNLDQKLELRKTSETGVVVHGINEEKVETPVDFAKLLRFAFSNRARGGEMAQDRAKKSHLWGFEVLFFLLLSLHFLEL